MNINTDSLRNVRLPIAISRPDTVKKALYVSCIVLYIMLVVFYFTEGFFIDYMYLELGLILGCLWIVSYLFDKLYYKVVRDVIIMSETSIVIGFSNKLLILQGDLLIDEYDTDEIKIREANLEEGEYFYGKFATILECMKNGEVVGKIGVGKLKEYEGSVLKPNMERADEDIEIVYDDEDEGDDEEDWGSEDSNDDLGDDLDE